jgi:aspartate carbamoyltransferase catalytic subunit
MQTHILAALTTLVALAAAWDMDVTYSDRTKLHFHGHTNSHCTKFKKHGAEVTSVYFKGSTLADTFELYSDDRCKDLVFKGKHGLNPVPQQQYGSYKVY